VLARDVLLAEGLRAAPAAPYAAGDAREATHGHLRRGDGHVLLGRGGVAGQPKARL